MKFHRIYAIILRHFYLFTKNVDRLTDAFYWPTIDLLLWGLTSTYFTTYAPETSVIVVIVVSGIILWLPVWRAQYEISINILEELWDKNLINLFVSPLKLSEWITSCIILGLLKSVVSVIFASFLAFFMYEVDIFAYGFYLIPFMALLIMTGWWMGFLTAAIVLRFGTKVQSLAWTLIMVIAPFSAIYYPVSTLPVWAQKIALAIPTSYVFEGAREVLESHIFDTNKLFLSLGLNIVYLILCIMLFKKSFKGVLGRGLVKVH